jgi:hypothetical protein
MRCTADISEKLRVVSIMGTRPNWQGRHRLGTSYDRGIPQALVLLLFTSFAVGPTMNRPHVVR